MTITGQIHVAMELWGVIFCLICALCIHASRDDKEKNRNLISLYIYNAILLFADSFAWIFRGYSETVGSYFVHISNFVVFFMGYIMLVTYTEYLMPIIDADTNEKKLWRRMIWGIAVIGITTLIISQFNSMYYYFDAENTYHRGRFFFISQFLGIAGTLINAVMLVRYHKKMRKDIFWSSMSYILLPSLAMVIQLFLYGIALLNIAVTVSLLWMFVVFLMNKGKKLKEQGECLIKQAELLVKQEQELSEMQRKIMLSQIQPHFLYNSLNTIYFLCEKDAAVAQKAINDFAEYLRGDLDSLKANRPVLFEKELRHIKYYLALEQIRFEDELRIEYDIQEEEFFLPALSIQPLVENAVKYGVGKAPEGGTVKIMTRKYDLGYEVIVSDDGVGFDMTEWKKDKRSHIGIENVRQRLQIMCGGTLSILSKKGIGTTATIKIPFRKEE